MRARVAWSLAASIAVVIAAVVVLAVFVTSLNVRTCTLLGSNPTVTVRLTSEDRADIRSGTVKVCDEDGCGAGDLQLPSCPESTAGDCSAVARVGRATIRGLPDGRSRITVTLKSAARSVSGSVDVESTMFYPNGEGCGGGSPQASVTWSDDGLKAS